MIYTERKVSIKNDKATIDSPIILFRGDREVEIMFTIVDSKFKFESNKGNVIDKTQAAFGQLAVALPDGTDLFTEIVECENGVVVFSITGEMIDEVHEVGFYSFHIRLYNDDKSSRITLPPVMEGIEIREPLIIEGDVENTDLVGDATVGYSMVQAVGTNKEVFDEDGNYIPTVWGIGDKITAEKLNKMEEGISNAGGEDARVDDILINVNDINTQIDDIETSSDTSMDFIPVTDELLSSQSYAFAPKEKNSKVTVNTQIDGLKCRLTGLNLFNPDEGIARISGGAYSAIPIYVKPNTNYDVYVYYKLGDAESNGLTGQTIINTDAFGYASGSAGMALKDLKADKKQTLTTKSHGCLYISFVYGDNESLNRMLNAFDIMIVETGTPVEGYVKGVSEFIDINVGETVVDTKEYNNLFFNIDRNSKDNMETALPACDITISKENLDYDVLKANLGLTGQVEKSPLIYFTENYASFIYSPQVPAAFKNINADIKISGTKGGTVLHVLDGSEYGISDFADSGNWNGVIGYGNNVYKSCLVTGADAEANTISIYPPLIDDITDGTLGNMLIDGMHLTKNGYRAYIQHNFSQNPKYCEKGKFLYRFDPSVNESLTTSPFTLIDDSGRADIGIGRLNINTAVRNAIGPTTYYVGNAWDELLEVKTGIQWEVPLKQHTGYFELFVSNGPNTVTNIMCDEGFEMHIEFYLDGELKTEYIKDTRHLECLRFDFENANTGKVVIYFNKIRMNNDEIRISQATWWVNEYEHSDRLIPNYMVVAQMFDSWGEFHDGETGVELSRLICEASGLTVPYTNYSKGGQTSAWGKAWWYENVRKYNPNIMVTDFGINDANSLDSPDTVPATVEGPDGKTYNNHISKDEYVTNMNIIFEMCRLNNIQPIMFGGCIGNYGIGIWYNTLCKGEQYPL